MGILDLFSKRQRRARGEDPDVYQYDELPQQLRVQIVHIIRDAFGKDHYDWNHAKQAYKFVKDALCREYGLFELTTYPKSDEESVLNFFLKESSIERALDVVEICFKVITVLIPENSSYLYHTDREMSAAEAVTELNTRFKEHGVGYRFESSEILRVDSEFMHSEVVKPVLSLLRGNEFKGANDEFLLAHDHYRHGRYKETLVNSLKAFESAMKSICKIQGWAIQPGDTAKALINTCLKQGLLPPYMESQMSSLRSLLESGVPTVRNKEAGHGQGPDLTVVPEYLARYALNLSATTILFIGEANAARG
ncbi:MAG TPA: hypothetical protein VK629_03110 [Steroidobacteraceae bacterium]|nr:hypothetical protein [Steroidobacteraceae bacterium]